MIVERKQYGCVTLLFVQIGLALYVIVLLLAPQANGGVKPVVLKVQKIAESKIASKAQISAVSSKIEEQLALSGYSATNVESVLALASISNADKTLLEDSIAESVSERIKNHIAPLLIEDGDNSILTSAYTAPTRTVALSDVQISIQKISFKETTQVLEGFSIHTLGISPRAPGFIA